LYSKIDDDVNKIIVLFLHFLMMTSTLFYLPSSNKSLHSLEYIFHSSQMSIYKIFVVDL